MQEVAQVMVRKGERDGQMGLLLPATMLQAYISALRRKQLFGPSRPSSKRANGAPRLVAEA
eukprot:6172401-Pleurochrysis_carterae.AAC.1